MKNNLSKTSLLVFTSLVCLFGCNQTNKSNNGNNQNETAKDTFAIADTGSERYETKYIDGRITAVRNLKYYNALVNTSKPLGDSKLGLTTVTSEWNEYDGNVATPQCSFTEKPLFLTEAEKSQMREAGVDGKSTMVGGDEETNERIKEPSIRYWAVASKMFEQEFSTLKKAKGISNRDVDYVTFDFITTNGFYTVQEKKSKLESGQSVWSNLFKESKFLNTEMERVQRESQQDAEKRFEARQLKKLKKSN
jgi:hypothetical protein